VKTPTDWRDVRVLVTGARGFIGARLCRRLVDAGAIVHGVSSRTNFVGRSSDVVWSAVDMTDRCAVSQMLQRLTPEVVFHLAGHVTGSQSLGEVESTFTQNLVSTVHLLTSAVEVGPCRVLLAGSMHEPERDDRQEIPVSPYAASKWACTAYARMFHQLYEFPVVIARPMMVYGPGQWDRAKLLPHVITSLLDGNSPSVSSGTRTLDWVFVDDVVAGMMTLATTPRTYGRTVDLGSGVLTSIRDIVERVVGIIGSTNPIGFGNVPDRLFEQPRSARIQETQELTGWTAETPLLEGLSKTVEYWRAALRHSVVISLLYVYFSQLEFLLYFGFSQFEFAAF
jgi:nucleoside-diphosphate-sugar epimerase